MRKIFLIFLSLQSFFVFAQNPDSLIKTIYAEKTDSAKIKKIYDIIENNGMLNPKDVIYYHTKILEETKKNNDKVCEAVITAELGFTIANISSVAKGTEMIFDALKMAEKTGNQQAIGIAYHDLGLVYSSNGDADKASAYMQKALVASKAAHNYYFVCSEMGFFGFNYLYEGKLDSAMIYMQDAYQLAITHKVDVVLSNILTGLSNIHLKMGNKRLAMEYLNTALEVPYVKLNPASLADVCIEKANFYKTDNNFDSTFFYANKAYQAIQHTLFSYRIGCAGFLKDLYKGRNSDSVLKYTTIYYDAKDSVANVEQIQKMQLLAFDETVRQEKLRDEKEKAEKDRKHNIQYAATAIGIICFIVLFLLLSRSLIVNTKWIEFLGVTGLLVVFEFINLLIHPYLAHYTNDSPVVMLFVLVLIAMLLVPLHHKLEKWVTGKIVEKNKQIRLAAAKKTIARLEGEMETKTD